MIPTFTDTHIHLWDLNSDAGEYGWLMGEADGLLGSLRELPKPLWDASAFLADVEQATPSLVVHVQASDPPGDPVAETAWLLREHATSGCPDAIVARVDLRAPDVARTIERHQACTDLVRGVRDMTLMGALDDPALERGLQALDEATVSWELACTWEEMPVALDLASRHPNLPIVLGHAGFPVARDADYLARWRAGLNTLASAPNMWCKVSGLGMGDHRWTVQSWRPMVQDCFDAFGIDRCMFGSNWPVDRLYSSYEAVLAAFDDITADLSGDERSQVFHANAARFYALDAEDAHVAGH